MRYCNSGNLPIMLSWQPVEGESTIERNSMVLLRKCGAVDTSCVLRQRVSRRSINGQLSVHTSLLYMIQVINGTIWETVRKIMKPKDTGQTLKSHSRVAHGGVVMQWKELILRESSSWEQATCLMVFSQKTTFSYFRSTVNGRVWPMIGYLPQFWREEHVKLSKHLWYCRSQTWSVNIS